MTEDYWKLFCVSTHSGLFGVMVMAPDWESVGCEFKYKKILFREKAIV